MNRNRKKGRLEKWQMTTLHRQYLRQTKEVKSNDKWVWLQRGELKRETESLILAAQDQCVKTNLIKTKIDKSQNDHLCKLCKSASENIHHIVCGCSKLT